MRLYLFLLILIGFLTSCTQNSGKGGFNNSSEKKIRRQVTSIAEDYANNQLKDAKKTVTKDGIIVFSSGNMKCLIDPSYILIGNNDEDTNKDAIVSLFTFQNQTLTLKEHLILINKGGKLVISKVLEGDMKFLSIKDMVLYIEISTIASDSPNFGCNLCKEVIKYQFIGGDTVRIK